MHHPQYRDAIHELVDGTLGPIRRAELQIHLDQCDACRALVEDLQRIHDAAATLDRPLPPNRVWMQIAGRLRQEGRVQAPSPASRRHYALAAIAATLLLAVGASVFLLLPRFRQAPASPTAAASQAQGNAAPDEVVQGVEAEFRLAEQHYQNAIAKLEEAARSDQNAIDPQTAAMLQKNLQVIDQAISESRAALKSEPQSVPARDSLFDALKRKVSLLQDTIALMNEMRKGNAAGAAQIVQGSKG
jgi:anti-sigma factor RsiW